MRLKIKERCLPYAKQDHWPIKRQNSRKTAVHAVLQSLIKTIEQAADPAVSGD
jgi:hypothetical protein